MRTLRASEIGVYLFCRRAWGYTKAGVESANQTELAAGSDMHRRHGQAVVSAGCLRAAAYLLLAVAISLATIALVNAALLP